MADVRFLSSDSDPEERSYFLAGALGALWHEIARAKEFLDRSTAEGDRGVKAWIKSQLNNSRSLYSCFQASERVG
jgi:hypothetical protein